MTDPPLVRPSHLHGAGVAVYIERARKHILATKGQAYLDSHQGQQEKLNLAGHYKTENDNRFSQSSEEEEQKPTAQTTSHFFSKKGKTQGATKSSKPPPLPTNSDGVAAMAASHIEDTTFYQELFQEKLAQGLREPFDFATRMWLKKEAKKRKEAYESRVDSTQEETDSPIPNVQYPDQNPDSTQTSAITGDSHRRMSYSSTDSDDEILSVKTNKDTKQDHMEDTEMPATQYTDGGHRNQFDTDSQREAQRRNSRNAASQPSLQCHQPSQASTPRSQKSSNSRTATPSPSARGREGTFKNTVDGDSARDQRRSSQSQKAQQKRTELQQARRMAGTANEVTPAQRPPPGPTQPGRSNSRPPPGADPAQAAATAAAALAAAAEDAATIPAGLPEDNPAFINESLLDGERVRRARIQINGQPGAKPLQPIAAAHQELEKYCASLQQSRATLSTEDGAHYLKCLTGALNKYQQRLKLEQDEGRIPNSAMLKFELSPTELLKEDPGFKDLHAETQALVKQCRLVLRHQVYKCIILEQTAFHTSAIRQMLTHLDYICTASLAMQPALKQLVPEPYQLPMLVLACFYPEACKHHPAHLVDPATPDDMISQYKLAMDLAPETPVPILAATLQGYLSGALTPIPAEHKLLVKQTKLICKHMARTFIDPWDAYIDQKRTLELELTERRLAAEHRARRATEDTQMVLDDEAPASRQVLQQIVDSSVQRRFQQHSNQERVKNSQRGRAGAGASSKKKSNSKSNRTNTQQQPQPQQGGNQKGRGRKATPKSPRNANRRSNTESTSNSTSNRPNRRGRSQSRGRSKSRPKPRNRSQSRSNNSNPGTPRRNQGAGAAGNGPSNATARNGGGNSKSNSKRKNSNSKRGRRKS